MPSTAGASLPVSPRGPARAIPPGFLGFNGEALTASPGAWNDPRFLSAVARLHPQVLRLFGGTTANYWNWRRGTFASGPGVPPELAAARPRVHLPLSVWARLIKRTGATPVYDLNLVTSSLSDQLAMLRAARKLGLPVSRVELGNELYLPRYASAFPTGANYGRVATRWIRAIHIHYPTAEIAVSGYLSLDLPGVLPDTRERTWNAGVLSTARGEAALAFHPYFRSGLSAPILPRAGRAAATLLGAPARRWRGVQSELGRLPSGVRAWMTEWNLFDRQAPVQGTWSQGLAVAEFVLDLASDPRVAQADNHALVGSAPFAALFTDYNGLSFGPVTARRGGPHPVAHAGGFTVLEGRPPRTVPFGLSASGVAMAQALAALRGSDRAQLLSLGGRREGGAPAQQGELFMGSGPRGSSHRAALLLNLAPRPARVRVGVLGAGGSFEQFSGDPAAEVTGPGSLRHRVGRLGAGAALTLPAYSLTRMTDG